MRNTISVRSLCEFSARTGDIDHRYTPSPSAIEGIQGHKQVQSKRKSPYEAERSVSGECHELTIRGRIDGYWPNLNRIEEIKTYRGDLEHQNPGQRALHRAQLVSYAALLCRELALDQIEIQLTYFNLGTESCTEIVETISASTALSQLEQYTQHYLNWQQRLIQAREAREIAIEALRFPFSAFRTGQRTLAESVFKACISKRELLMEAPTGAGKTLGTLFPAIRSMTKAQLNNLIYLSTRNTARLIGLQAYQQLNAAQDSPLPLRVVELCSKQDGCVNPDAECQAQSCPLALGFFDRLPGAREEAFGDTGSVMDRQRLAEIAERHQICPYYLGQEMARWADIVFADMNQYLSPSAILWGYLIQDEWNSFLLCDESHNLVDRSRALYSTSFSQTQLNALTPVQAGWLKRELNSVKKSLTALAKTLEGKTQSFSDKIPQNLIRHLQSLCSAITDRLIDNPRQSELTELLFAASAFLKLEESFDSHSVLRIEHQGRGKTSLEIRNLDPSPFLTNRWSALQGCCLFSATLKPVSYFKDLLGLSSTLVSGETPPPYRPEQLSIHVFRHIDTRYQQRTSAIAPIVKTLSQTYTKRPGNYLFFTSSFGYLEQIAEQLSQFHPEIPLRAQSRRMSPVEREAFLSGFTETSQQIGLAVMGGFFSEGVDLPGNRLIGVAIATLGLPPFDELSELMKERMDQRYSQGYEYTYLYPGIQKVIQAAGRLIRTEEDEGTLLLLDYRFAEPRVQALFPGWWPGIEVISDSPNR